MLETERTIRRSMLNIAVFGAAYCVSLFPANWLVIACAFCLGSSVVTGFATGIMEVIAKNKE